MGTVHRFSSRRHRLDKSFLSQRLRNARSYDRIAGYFRSSLLEIAGEELESVTGPIRMVCNSDLNLTDVQTARAAKLAMRQEWTRALPEHLVEPPREGPARKRYTRLYQFLSSGKLQVKVLPNRAFGLIHGKAGVITLADGSQTAFLGSANETREAWQMNYELLWEDTSPEGVAWVQEEFDALWTSHHAVELAEVIIEDVGRIARRKVIYTIPEWTGEELHENPPEPAPAMIETPVYRRENGLWAHQKYFVKLAFDAHNGPMKKARFVLADQVGLGKTLQLAMTAMLIALTGDKPILIIAPKTLLWQWQGEMRDLLDMPSAVWDGRQWVDEVDIAYPNNGVDAIRKCPRRVGIVSSGLITRRSEASEQLMRITYDCVILDEAHRARRKKVDRNNPYQPVAPNNLLKFMQEIAPRTRSLFLATATPAQLHPIEAWDLLEVLGRGDESVLGNMYSRWRQPERALPLVMGQASLPTDIGAQWEWMRNSLPPKEEGIDFELLRRSLNVDDSVAVVPGDALSELNPRDQSRIKRMFPSFVQDDNPFIHRIIRRSREYLEKQIDLETGEPMLHPIGVELFGENQREAIPLPPYLEEAYQLAEAFTEELGERMRGAGFLKTLLLRRVGSTIYAGRKTAEKMLSEWEELAEDWEEDADISQLQSLSRTLTTLEKGHLEHFLAALEANQERDPKYTNVKEYLFEKPWRDGDNPRIGWLERGVIIFSQYRDSIQWLAEQLTKDLPEEPIALYSGPQTSGLMLNGEWTPRSREDLKQLVAAGEIRLMLGTDAASEGLNLQRLGSLINLDLPWNPTRLEQRKGRIQRIGQICDKIFVYNMRYRGSVEDRVHELLSERFNDIYQLFGQLPDVLEDVWVDVALGEQEQAKKVIDAVPKQHPFELRYVVVESIDWESCADVLFNEAKLECLRKGW